MPELIFDPARLCNRLMGHILDNELWHDHWQDPATWRFRAEAYFPDTDFLPRGFALDSAGLELAFPERRMTDYRLKLLWYPYGALYATTASWNIQTGTIPVTTVTPLDGTHGVPDLALLQRWLLAGLVRRIKHYRLAFDRLEPTVFVPPLNLTPEDLEEADDLKVPFEDLDNTPFPEDAPTAAQLADADAVHRQRNEAAGFTA